MFSRSAGARLRHSVVFDAGLPGSGAPPTPAEPRPPGARRGRCCSSDPATRSSWMSSAVRRWIPPLTLPMTDRSACRWRARSSSAACHRRRLARKSKRRSKKANSRRSACDVHRRSITQSTCFRTRRSTHARALPDRVEHHGSRPARAGRWRDRKRR